MRAILSGMTISQMKTEDQLIAMSRIAGTACEALAELSSRVDPSGKMAEAIMCDWTGEPNSPGECAVRHVVEFYKTSR